MWEVRYVRIEDNREDPAVPCCRRIDADSVDRDLPEQYIWGDFGNPGIYLRPDRDNQCVVRTGLRLGSIKNDSHWVCDIHDTRRWRKGSDNNWNGTYRGV